MEILATSLQVLASLFMAFIWIAFLRKVDVFQPEAWKKMIIAFIFGCSTPFMVLGLHQVWPNLNIEPESISGSFRFFTLNVGLVEELAKFLGFVIFFLIFRKWFDENLNFLIYGSAIGLGFATVENFLYMHMFGIELVYIRGLICAFGHLSGTAVIASFLCRGIQKKNIYIILYPLMGIVLMAVLHGIYDTTLSSGAGLFGMIIAAYIFMVEFELWTQFANNFLNQSQFYKNNIAVDRDTMQKFLFASFIIAGVIQLIGLIIKEGWMQGFLSHFLLLAMEGILTLIMVSRITRHTVVPGYWQRVFPRLPFKRVYVENYGTTSSGEYKNSYLSIRGDEFNEYPFTSRINKLTKLIPLRTSKYTDNEIYQCWILDKLFLGEEKSIYYFCELAGHQFNFKGTSPKYFLIQPKLKGSRYVKEWPIISMLALPANFDKDKINLDEVQFIRWSIFKDEDVEKLHQTWREMIF